jgi:hypothetical protein
MMLAVATPLRSDSPTGLLRREIAGLKVGEKRELYTWQAEHGGDNNGKLWLPAAVRSLELDARLALANDPDLTASWQEREARRVSRSVAYFIRAYGHVQPNKGPPVPFDLWPDQLDALETIMANEKTVAPKSRQIGITWLGLHIGFHYAAFEPDTPNAKVLCLSKHGEDAGKLIIRARRILQLLPPFLRPVETTDSLASRRRMSLARGSEIVSLTGSPEAARQETATFVLADEFAFIRHRQAGKTLTALGPTVDGGGKLLVVSTGNGRTGDGEGFAETVEKGLKGENDFVVVFLSWRADPRRTEEWRERKVKAAPTEEEGKAEYPDTIEEALGGDRSVRVYPDAHLGAAKIIGEALEADVGRFEIMVASEGIEWGIDWGDFQTFAVYAVGLPGGGMYIFDELALRTTEPTQASEEITGNDPAGIPSPRFIRSSADSNPAGTNKTFAAVLARKHELEPQRFPEKHWRIEFGRFKQGGVNTVGYIRYLLGQAAAFIAEHPLVAAEAKAQLQTPAPTAVSALDELDGVLAIHPRCKNLLAQMANLERDPDTGKVRKPALDPNNLQKGDHGPDAVVALGADRAMRWNALLRTREDG